MSNQSANAQTGGFDKPMTDEQEDMYLRGLPKVVRQYLLNDSPVFWSARTVYRIYRENGQHTLSILREISRLETEAAYGPMHPQARR